MADPGKLLASASRLYGDQMDYLWGEFLPVPVDALVALKGGERLDAGGCTLDVAYTPGHASHHVSYYSGDTGVAFVGDTAGIKLRPDGPVLAPTPPPDIDVELWKASLATIEAWRPGTLFLTHFGPSQPYESHVNEVRENLDWIAQLADTLLAREGGDDGREQWFVDEVRRLLRRRLGEPEVQAYETAGRFDLSWRGMARYWSKKRAVPR
jgi:glyoxylase-like metal-dependent hydrolase (beta-lactamase superfamily II)